MRQEIVKHKKKKKMFFQAFVENIRNELNKFPAHVRNEVVILFSAHSLPMKVSD